MTLPTDGFRSDEPAWKVVDLPGSKCKGVVATRNLKRGELILEEEPLPLRLSAQGLDDESDYRSESSDEEVEDDDASCSWGTPSTTCEDDAGAVDHAEVENDQQELENVDRKGYLYHDQENDVVVNKDKFSFGRSVVVQAVEQDELFVCPARALARLARVFPLDESCAGGPAVLQSMLRERLARSRMRELEKKLGLSSLGSTTTSATTSTSSVDNYTSSSKNPPRPPLTREAFAQLHDAFETVTKCKTALGIWQTNALSIPSSNRPGESDLLPAVICPRVARLNHSCTPNVLHCFVDRDGNDSKALGPASGRRCTTRTTSSSSGGVMRVVAARDILVGEELCTSYCDVTDDREGRQEFLHKFYRFECTCVACSRPQNRDAAGSLRRSEDEIESCDEGRDHDVEGMRDHCLESDERRAHAGEVLDAAAEFEDSLSSTICAQKISTKDIQLALRALEAERLLCPMLEFRLCAYAFRTQKCTSKRSEASTRHKTTKIDWGTRALSALILAEGSDSLRAQNWQRLLVEKPVRRK
ncbi:unnamed protein product [Amoebophrya sp. A25]|nr:unnamed protein product [Amoebophrya sp. A25]|eukprot:GSA25T00014175001.1